MTKYFTLVAANTLSLVIMLFANFAASTGRYSKKTVADVSHKYDTLFAPAGYAFSIWGLIFLLCIGFVAFQWFTIRQVKTQEYISKAGLWFTISNLANIAWLYCWVNEMIGASVLLILLLLASLVLLTIALRLELDDVQVRYIFFVWWPIAIYLGWIIVATVACVSAWLTSLHWAGWGIENVSWTVILIVVAAVIYLVLLATRNLRESALVGVWAIIAIAVRQWTANPAISYAGIFVTALLLAAVTLHGYSNRKFNVFSKLGRGEW